MKQLTYIITYLLICLLTYLLITYLLACLLTYLLTYLLLTCTMKHILHEKLTNSQVI